MTEMTNATVDVKILIEEDNCYLLDNGVKSDALEVTKDGLCFKLPENSANRVWFSLKKIDAAKAAGQTEIALTYKASRTIGSVGTRIPNEKLISYLPEDLQAEYKAIIERAIAAKNDAKAKPMTELEKAQAKVEKARLAYEKLLKESQGE